MNTVAQTIRRIRLDDPSAEALPVRVTNELEALIDSGRLTAGTVLPPTRQLADLLGVSVHVAQDACSRLAERHRVERKRRVGTVVLGRVRTRTVGLLSAIDPTLPQAANVGWVLAQEFMRAAEAHAYGVRHYLVSSTNGQPALPANLVTDLKDRALDAVLVGAVYSAIVAQYVKTEIPVLHLDPVETGLRESLEDAVRWLWRQDARRPALVVEEGSESRDMIETAFRSACAGFQLGVDPGHVVRAPLSRIAEGQAVYDRLMGNRQAPDGVVIMDDMVGCGFLREIAARGGPDPARVVVMTNQGSALHIDERCPQIEIDWGLVVDRALAQVAAAARPGAGPAADDNRPGYRFVPPAVKREAGNVRREK